MSTGLNVTQEDLNVSNALINQNLIVLGNIVGRTLAVDSLVTNILQVREGAMAGWVLTSIDDEGNAMWAPVGDIVTVGTVADGDLVVYNGASGDELRSAQTVRMAADGSLCVDQLVIKNALRYENAPVSGHVLIANDNMGNLVFGPLPGGGNVTTAGGSLANEITVWNGGVDVTSRPGITLSVAGDMAGLNSVSTVSVVASGGIVGNGLTDGVATLTGGNLTGALAVTASGAIAGGSLTDGTATLAGGSLSGAVNIGFSGTATGGDLVANNATLNTNLTMGAAASLLIPNGAVNGYVLTTDGSGNATWQPEASGGTITGGGTTDVLTKFTGPTAIGDVGPNVFAQGDANSNLRIGQAAALPAVPMSSGNTIYGAGSGLLMPANAGAAPNTIIGSGSALDFSTAMSTGGNVLVGDAIMTTPLPAVAFAGSSNTIVGNFAGGVNVGQDNILIGCRAGNPLAPPGVPLGAGSSNIIIGDSSATGSATAASQILIGGLIASQNLQDHSIIIGEGIGVNPMPVPNVPGIIYFDNTLSPSGPVPTNNRLFIPLLNGAGNGASFNDALTYDSSTGEIDTKPLFQDTYNAIDLSGLSNNLWTGVTWTGAPANSIVELLLFNTTGGTATIGVSTFAPGPPPVPTRMFSLANQEKITLLSKTTTSQLYFYVSAGIFTVHHISTL